jgi:hypothetical protein
MRSVALVCTALLAVTRSAECTQSRPSPGIRIRFDAPSLGGRLTGTLMEWEADTLRVSVDGYAPGLALLVPTDSVTRLEIIRQRTLTLEGLGLGVLAGTIVAVIASPDVLDEDGNCTTVPCIAYQVSPHMDTRIAVLGAVGALAGMIVGSVTKTATWVAVPLKRVEVGPTPDGGVALGLRISF